MLNVQQMTRLNNAIVLFMAVPTRSGMEWRERMSCLALLLSRSIASCDSAFIMMVVSEIELVDSLTNPPLPTVRIRSS